MQEKQKWSHLRTTVLFVILNIGSTMRHKKTKSSPRCVILYYC